MATPTEMAREAHTQIALLRAEFEIHQRGIETLKLIDLRERLAVLDEKIAKLERELEAVKCLPVIVVRVDKLEQHRDETDKRRWQFVVLFVGGILTLAINLVVSFVRK